MALTQVQIIQSLAEALSWFEKELSWEVAPGELGHLTGRIGELYAAMITRGQMALETHQRGYDVISADNERISVKTITSSSHVSFNVNTMDLVDRVMVLRVNIDEENGVSVETLMDSPAADFIALCRASGGRLTFSTHSRARLVRPLEDLKVTEEATYGGYLLRKYENGTMSVVVDGQPLLTAKPALREIAGAISVDLLNGNSQPKNTRQLGADILKTLKSTRSVKPDSHEDTTIVVTPIPADHPF